MLRGHPGRIVDVSPLLLVGTMVMLAALDFLGTLLAAADEPHVGDRYAHGSEYGGG
jgi:hypothetical protein